MSIPNWYDIEKPMLETIARLDKGSGVPFLELEQPLADHFRLTETERNQVLTSKPPRLPRRKFLFRMGWASTSLTKKKLICRPDRGMRSLTEKGKKLLAEGGETDVPPVVRPPTETDYSSEMKALDDLKVCLKELDTASLTRFEKIVETMLRQMGYGVTPSKQQSGSVKFLISLEHSLGSVRMCVFIESGQSVNRKRLQQYSHEMKTNAAQQAVVFICDKVKSKSGRKKPAGDNRFILVSLEDLARLVIKHEVDITKP